MNPIAIRLLNQQLIAPQFSIPAEVVRYMGAIHASFFEEDFESEDVSETWQSYNSYRNK